MFDDKKEVDDMFAETDGAQPAAPVAAPTQAPSALLTPPPIRTSAPAAAPTPAPQAVASEPVSGGFGVMKTLLVILVVLGLVGGAAYAAYRIMVSEPTATGVLDSLTGKGTAADDTTSTAGATTDDTTTDTTSPTTTKNPETFLDSDGDGLTNAEELDAGTLANNPDTDSDGLGDREEVKVYDTNPRKADTDGDTFLDGQEVAGGYNPNGDGKLFNVPTTP